MLDLWLVFVAFNEIVLSFAQIPVFHSNQSSRSRYVTMVLNWQVLELRCLAELDCWLPFNHILGLH